MNENNQLKVADAIVAAILAAVAGPPSPDPKTIVKRFVDIHAILVKSGGALAPGTQPY